MAKPKYGVKKITVTNPTGYRAKRGARKGFSVTVKEKKKKKPRVTQPRFQPSPAGIEIKY